MKGQSAPLERLSIPLQKAFKDIFLIIFFYSILLGGCSVVSVAVSVMLHGSNNRW